MVVSQPPTKEKLSTKARLQVIWKTIRRDSRLKTAAFLVSMWFGLGFTMLAVEQAHEGTLLHGVVDTLYYTMTTITGTGYGDITPKQPQGRIVAMLLMAVGVISVSMVTANIASYLVDLQLRESRGLMTYKIHNHFLVCGYKPELLNILEDMLSVNPGLEPEMIVLVHSADPQLMEGIRSNPKLKGIRFVHGEINDETVLTRADAPHAKTALVLADTTNMAASDQEIDSRTLTCVLSLRNMSRDLYICGELLDERLEKHLRLSGCDEVILSKTYSRTLLANASAATGISQVVATLIDVNKDTLNIVPIAPRFVGKTFKDLMDHLLQTEGTLILGILENVGNTYHRKQEALKEAQKEPDISKLVKNLKFVKEMVPNRPVLNPGPDYILLPHSNAIVVGGGQPWAKVETSGMSNATTS